MHWKPSLYYNSDTIFFSTLTLHFIDWTSSACGCTNQQPDGFLSLRAFEPSSSDSADRGRSIIQVTIDLFILKNMGAAIVKVPKYYVLGVYRYANYGFSSTGVTIYCYFGLKFNDNTCCEVIYKRRYNNNDTMTTNKFPGMYFFLITVIFPIQISINPTW